MGLFDGTNLGLVRAPIDYMSQAAEAAKGLGAAFSGGMQAGLEGQRLKMVKEQQDITKLQQQQAQVQMESVMRGIAQAKDYSGKIAAMNNPLAWTNPISRPVMEHLLTATMQQQQIDSKLGRMASLVRQEEMRRQLSEQYGMSPTEEYNSPKWQEYAYEYAKTRARQIADTEGVKLYDPSAVDMTLRPDKSLNEEEWRIKMANMAGKQITQTVSPTGTVTTKIGTPDLSHEGGPIETQEIPGTDQIAIFRKGGVGVRVIKKGTGEEIKLEPVLLPDGTPVDKVYRIPGSKQTLDLRTEMERKGLVLPNSMAPPAAKPTQQTRPNFLEMLNNWRKGRPGTNE